MARIVRERTLTLPQLTQISVNTEHLEVCMCACVRVCVCVCVCE